MLYRLEIDGKAVEVPRELLEQLDSVRRSFSYDSQSGGIKAFDSGSGCRMGGPAMGSILQVRYLTYKDWTIVKDEMKPVYSESGNCLFSEGFAPKNPDSEKDAAKAVGILETIRALKK